MCDAESDSGRGAVDEQKLQHEQARLATTLHARRTDGSAGTRRTRRGAVAIAALLVAVGGALIVSTYTEFSETVDEPVHIAAGMQWLDRGEYSYSPLNPPLPRVASALAPYLAGGRSHGLQDPVAEGNALLYEAGRYARNLALARLGTLPFFLLAAAVVWVWTRRLAGETAALVGVGLFCSLPTVLGHSALATTDAALMATLSLSLWLFVGWLEEPSPGRGARLGAALGLAALSKFSVLLFFPAAAAAILGVRWLFRRNASPTPTVRRLGSIALAWIVAAGVLWAGYRFAWGPTRPGGISLPAPALRTGLGHLASVASGERPVFLLGRQSLTGWWYYFPVALGVKTPLPFLILAVIGAAAALALARKARNWRWLAPPAAAAAMLLAVLPTRLDLGIRYILPIYPLLSITASIGVMRLWSSRRLAAAARVLAFVLLAWQVWACVRTHPDHMAYFNEIAGDHPERVLLDSNLDWGQDLLRLSEELSRRNVPSVSICYFGNADFRKHGLPNPRRLAPNQRTTGWIAVSEMCLLDPSYFWLRDREPEGRAGRSIRLYYMAD